MSFFIGLVKAQVSLKRKAGKKRKTPFNKPQKDP